MGINRRDFFKLSAIGSASSVAGQALAGSEVQATVDHDAFSVMATRYKDCDLLCRVLQFRELPSSASRGVAQQFRPASI